MRIQWRLEAGSRLTLCRVSWPFVWQAIIIGLCGLAALGAGGYGNFLFLGVSCIDAICFAPKNDGRIACEPLLYYCCCLLVDTLGRLVRGALTIGMMFSCRMVADGSEDGKSALARERS
jgi:hypothetical protein